MMIDPFSYVDQYKDASCQEILKFKSKRQSRAFVYRHSS